jgi:hypothetical protein
MLSNDSSPHHTTSTTESPTRPFLPKEALVMAQASASAEAVAAGRQAAFTAPAGFQLVGTVTGWDTDANAAPVYGYWIQNKKIQSEYMLAIRGTQGDAETIEDQNITPTSFQAFISTKTSPTPQVHGGFWNIYSVAGKGMAKSMQGQLFEFLDKNKTSISTLYIGGHSLGGALAELFAIDLAISLPTSGPAVVRTITYAAPMVGLKNSWDTAYAQYASRTNTLRVVNELDKVPTLPGNIFGYQYVQVGTAFDVRFYNQLSSTTQAELGIRHEIGNYLTVATNAQSRSPQVWTGTFADALNANTTDTSATPNM